MWYAMRAVLGACSLIPAVAAVAQQDGTGDISFGYYGHVEHLIDEESDYIEACVLQADGKIIVGASQSSYYQDNSTVKMVRFNTDGSKDSTYSGDAIAEINFCTSEDILQDLALQPDGKLVGCGYEFFSGGSGQAVLFRMNENGTVDAGFGNSGNGFAYFLVPGYDQAKAVRIRVQEDGMIYGIATYWTGSAWPPVLFRYTETGQLDTTFGNFGIQPCSDAGLDGILDAAFLPDGKVILTGYSPSYDLVACRYLPSGALDPDFGVNGRAYVAYPGHAPAKCLAIRPDGRILVVGIADQQLVAAQYLENGTIDPEFGQGGYIAHDYMPGVAEDVYDVVVKDDGRAFIAWDSWGYGRNYGVVCLAINGAPVITFAGSSVGLAYWPMTNDYAVATRLALQPDGKLVIAARCRSEMPDYFTTNDIGLARRIPAAVFHVLGVEEMGTAQAGIRPNPASANDRIRIEGNEPGASLRTELIDQLGRLVWTAELRTAPDGTLTIPLAAIPGLASGCYQVRCSTAAGTGVRWARLQVL